MNKLLIAAILLLILIGLTYCSCDQPMSRDEQLLWDIFTSKEGDPPIILPPVK